MEKTRAGVLLLMFCLAFSLMPAAAQEGGDEEQEPIPSDWSNFMPNLYARGDQTFNISLGLTFPVLFIGASGEKLPNNISLGGTLSLSYNYFITSGFFVGGELGLMFAGTVGSNMLFIVPFGVRAGYQVVLSRFEFPVSLTIGGAPETYLETNYFGLWMKPEVSVFFRFSPDWSFGINGAWWWLPQWTAEPSKDANGHFVELTLSARYHF
jgi:hypothetical protein